MNIFAFFRSRNRQRLGWVQPKRVERPAPVFKSSRPPADIRPQFSPTHIHVRTGKPYMLTSDGARLEVTADEAYPLAEYEDEAGNRYAQEAGRFHDGRFKELVV